MLRPTNKNKAKKAKFAVYDIEAKSIEKNTEFAMIGYYDGYVYKYSQSIIKFLEFILKDKNNGLYIYGHYAGKYDALFILDEMAKQNFDKINGWKVGRILDSAGRIICLEFVKFREKFYKQKNKMYSQRLSIKFADSYSLFPYSLDKVAKSMGVGAKSSHDHTKEFEFNEENIDYNYNDCMILYASLAKFYTKYCTEVGCHLTMASAAMAMYRRFFQPEIINGLSMEQENFVRKSYAGGRCEVFKMKAEDGVALNSYDVNSLYPYVMLQEMPNGVSYWTNEYEPDKIGFYEIEADVPKDTYVPILYTKLDGLKFGVGKVTGIFDTAEIELAKKQGAKITVKGGIVFTKKSKLFYEYVKYYYNMKVIASEEGDEVNYFIAKAFLNSLSGKFAQKRSNTTLQLVDTPDELLKLGDKATVYDFERSIYAVKRNSRAAHIIPSISAHINSLGRVELDKYLLKYADEVYYCDTDCLKTTATIETGIKIGDMKLENVMYNAQFPLPKTYEYDSYDENGELKHYKKDKGFDATLKLGDLKIAGYKSALKQNKIIEVEHKNDPKYAAAIEDDSKHTFLKRTTYNRSRKAVYDKRRVLEDGINTAPIEFGGKR